jgi:hypothetical protein
VRVCVTPLCVKVSRFLFPVLVLGKVRAERLAAAFGENEESLVLRVLLEFIENQSAQRVHARPQITGIQRDEDAH